MTSEARLIALRQEVARVARMVGMPEGHAPSREQFRRHGRLTPERLQRMVGGRKKRGLPAIGWVEAVHSLGFRPTPVSQPIERAAIKADLLYGRGGHGPSTHEFEARVPYGAGAVTHRFRCWNAMVERAGYKRRSGGRPLKEQPSDTERRAA